MILNAFGVGFKSKTTIVTNAQFKDLENNPIQLVTAPGAGKIRVPLLIYLKKNFVAGYDAVAELDNISVGYDGRALVNLANALSPGDMYLNQFLTSNLNLGTFLLGFASGLLSHIGSGGGGWNGVVTVVPNIGGENEPLLLAASESFTGGNSANVLIATTIYTTLRY